MTWSTTLVVLAGIGFSGGAVTRSVTECGHCHEFAMQAYHEFEPGGETDTKCAPTGCHTAFYSGPCHVGCFDTDDLTLDVVQQAAVAEDLEALEALFKRDASIRFNEARQAIQILGCHGVVLAHFPLSGATAAGLSEALHEE